MKTLFKIAYRVLAFIAVLIIFVIIVIMISNSLKTATHDRDWSEESAILPDIELSSSTISISNMRDWRYGYKEVKSRDYYEATFDPQKVSKAYLFLNPFGKWEGVGHAFFVFEFEDGESVAVSIEARSEKGEKYSAVRGLFNEYELWYVFGSPADLLSRRAIYHNEDLYMYDLKISKEGARELFVDLATTAQQLETEPGFYNTVSSNCTNLLADSANRVKKGSIPFHYSRLFTGYADNQLYALGFIRNDVPFEQVYEESRIDGQLKEEYLEKDRYTRDEFWKFVTEM